MLKHRSDIQSVVYMLLAPALLWLMWQYGPTMPMWVWVPVYALQLLIAVTFAVMCHNHKHLPMWKNKVLNHLTDNWLTVFYGFPVFAWVPTHMHNHHNHVNTLPDYTRTYRVSEQNNLLTLLSYPTLSGGFQQPAVRAYFSEMWRKDRSKALFLMIQLMSLVLFTGFFLWLDWRLALVYVMIPQQVSLFSVLIFNYVQHIHADEETEYNNSRNFLGRLLNFLLLNNGYHTAHHLWAGVHWSQLPQKHKEVEHLIHPSLNETDFGWYLLRTYVLGMFVAKFRSYNMREARMAGKPLVVEGKPAKA